MKNDIDMKLYNEYLSGEKGAFELLYNKYKDRIKYFIFNILKDYEKAEDITQETFIYVWQNKIKEGYTFKSYLFLVAKSRAINYFKTEKRRNEIIDKYLSNDSERIEPTIDEIVSKKEEKNELIKSIDLLDERYRNAIYLTKIEEFSYKETADILEETVQNVKNYVHRGKNELRKILIKKGFKEMNKVLKFFIIGIIVTVTISGITYAVTVVYQKMNNSSKNNTNHNISINPTYNSTINEDTINNLWIGTLDLAWKELENNLGQNNINLVDGNLPIVNDLNNSNFSKEMLDSNDYEISVEKNLTGGYNINSTLNKELNFLEVFDNFSDYNKNMTFGDGEKFIKYFGINNASPESMNKNIEILFFNNESDESALSNDFAIKLNTQEGDEIILYRTNDNKSFDEYYNDIKEKSNLYTGRTEFGEDDELLIPYVRVNGMIAYNELCGKYIKGTKNDAMYFQNVVQNVNFSLNEKGCNLGSTVSLITMYMGIGLDMKLCYFKDQFVIFMKEKDCQDPYFALKVDNDDILEKVDEVTETKIVDYTKVDSERYKAQEKEVKFFEDENYEYYFPVDKRLYVMVYYPDGMIDTVGNALKEGKITIDLLDEYEIDYIKKEK